MTSRARPWFMTLPILSPEDGRDRCVLMARDRAVESWLHDQVGPAYDALKADPSRAVTADQVRARLAAEHAKTRQVLGLFYRQNLS